MEILQTRVLIETLDQTLAKLKHTINTLMPENNI